MYTCGIIEDEYLAQELLVKYIDRFEGLEIKWLIETITAPSDLAGVDIVFLDLLDNPSNEFRISPEMRLFAAHFSNVIITSAFPLESVAQVNIPHVQLLTKPYNYTDFANAVTQTIAKSLQVS